MQDDEPDIEDLARLSFIKISEREKEALKREIKVLSKLIQKITSAPYVNNVYPLYHPLDIEGAKRGDDIALSEDRKPWVQSALELENSLVKAPRTLEE